MIDGLCAHLKLSGYVLKYLVICQITWLEFMHQSEYSEEYSAWCKETGLSESEESAFLFSEKKDFDSIVAPHFELD